MTVTSPRWDELKSCREHLRSALRNITKVKPRREVEDELRLLHAEALIWASKHADCYAPTLEQVRRADTHAAGHVDWSSKLPLYVSELVYGLDPWSNL